MKSPQLIGRSPALLRIEEDIQCAAESDAKVLITGESGVGKEIVASLIHERSRRRSAPLVTVNCAGVPDTLLASELFGHVKGSFTDAHRDRRGWLEQADKGTIFMDEVGEMSAQMQSLLLRFLDNGEIQQVGSSHRALGLLAARQGRRRDARKAFERALEFEPDNVAAVNGLVSLDLAADDSNAARSRVDEWLRSRPNDSATLMLAARVHSRSGDLDAAEGLLRQLLEVAPDNLEAYAALGHLYWRQDRLDEALGEFEALATRSPNPASALTMAGVLLQAQGRVDEARERLEQAIDVDPRPPWPPTIWRGSMQRRTRISIVH